jgi:hypothetical protein
MFSEKYQPRPLSINLSNQFYEDLRILYDLEAFIKKVPLKVQCK